MTPPHHHHCDKVGQMTREDHEPENFVGHHIHQLVIFACQGIGRRDQDQKEVVEEAPDAEKLEIGTDIMVAVRRTLPCGSHIPWQFNVIVLRRVAAPVTIFSSEAEDKEANEVKQYKAECHKHRVGK